MNNNVCIKNLMTIYFSFVAYIENKIAGLYYSILYGKLSGEKNERNLRD